MSGFVLRVVVAAAAIGLVALAAPSIATAASGPGDILTVAGGGEVLAPPPGSAVAVSVDRLDGASTTQVVSTDLLGVVTVSDGVSTDAALPSDSPDKCADSAYSVMGGANWPAAYDWRFRTASTPKYLTPTKALRALKLSISNITKSHNECGMADEVSASSRYLGSTDLASDASFTAGCGAPSMQNVTEFAPIDGTNILAVTCVYSAGPNIVAASVRINTNIAWTLRRVGCTSAYGLLATMTHEYGHAFGLSHVEETEHRNLTMSSAINDDCSSFESNLGLGDVLGLRALY